MNELSRPLARLVRARERLQDRDDRVALAMIAREARLSVGELIRRFAAAFGETPHRFRSRERLERAKALLAASRCSVTDVCMEVGFSSLGSFSTWFARQVGVAPSTYRTRARLLAVLPTSSPMSLQPGCLCLLESALAIAAISEK